MKSLAAERARAAEHTRVRLRQRELLQQGVTTLPVYVTVDGQRLDEWITVRIGATPPQIEAQLMAHPKISKAIHDRETRWRMASNGDHWLVTIETQRR